MSSKILKWSDYQLAIFENVKSDEGNLVVEALAGSAKSSSLIESLKYIPSGSSWMLLAFNKKIAEELKLKAAPGGSICTLHSLGLKAIGKTYKRTRVNFDKMKNIFTEMLGNDKSVKDFKYQLDNAVSLCKGYLASSDNEIDEVLDTHEIDSCNFSKSDFIKNIKEALERSKDVSCVNFDDMIWLPNVLDLKMPKYDRVFVDEAQDLNNAQIQLVLKLAHKPPVKKSKKIFKQTRITVFLDKNQAIYGWRGANINAYETFMTALNAKSLPLSISYRCPLSVVEEAKKYVPHFEAAPNAKEGVVGTMSLKELKQYAKPGCFILSRTNAPLIGLAMNFIKNRIPCNIQGRDIGENLINIIKNSKASNLKDFLAYLERWSQAEIKRLTEKERDCSAIIDKVECFEALAENCEDLNSLKDVIKKLFDDVDDKKIIILSTIHRIKGAERDVVYLLNYTFFNGAKQEESNIKYVGITRSSNELYYIYNSKEEPVKEK